MTADLGIRVRQAREFRGWSQSKLAREVGRSQPMIAHYERGKHDVPSDVLAEIADKTGFPDAFFHRPSPPPVAPETVRFREHSRLRVRDRDKAQITIELAYELLDRLAEGDDVRLPALRLPNRDFASPAQAAVATRTHLGLTADRPVDHACRALERGGVRVFQVPADADGAKLQAFSGWAGANLGDAFVTLYRSDAGDRLRWSLAHELGHLVLHRRMPEEDRAEQEANEFAAEFLLPEQAIRDEFGGHVTLSSLAEMKRRWKVSIAALVMRGADVGVIDDRRKRSLFVQLSRRGWRTNEPVPIDPERPRLLRQLVERRYGERPDLLQVAADFGLSFELVTTLLVEQAASTTSRTGQRSGAVIALDDRRKTNR